MKVIKVKKRPKAQVEVRPRLINNSHIKQSIIGTALWWDCLMCGESFGQRAANDEKYIRDQRKSFIKGHKQCGDKYIKEGLGDNE